MSEASGTGAGSNALTPVGPVGIARRGHNAPVAGRGARALARLVGRSAVRRAAFAGVAFGAGFQLSRMLRGAQLPEAASTARDVLRVAAGGDPVAEGRLAGQWVRETITIVVGMPGTRGRRGGT